MESNVHKSLFKKVEEIALSLIDWEDKKRCYHSSFVIHKKRIIAIGINQPKTHPINLINRKQSLRTGEDISDQKHTCSELSAILKLKRLTNIDTEKCTLINVRYNRNKELALAAPCQSCRSLLKYHQFKNVIFTNNKGDYEIHSADDF